MWLVMSEVSELIDEWSDQWQDVISDVKRLMIDMISHE